jgi:ComF family protein
VVTTWQSLGDVLFGVLSPARCAACDGWVRASDFCAACDVAPTALIHSVGGHTVVAAAPYDSGVGRAVARLKYGSRPDLARPLARRLCAALREAAGRGVSPHRRAVLVPVPLHPLKLAERGFNQSALLAAHLSSTLGWSFRPRALMRTRSTPPQASLSREGRLGNLRGAFLARETFHEAHVVLVDDVLTTGATAAACVGALLEAGVAKVTIAAVARADTASSASARKD